jgi:hypothetical protein
MKNSLFKMNLAIQTIALKLYKLLTILILQSGEILIETEKRCN